MSQQPKMRQNENQKKEDDRPDNCELSPLSNQQIVLPGHRKQPPETEIQMKFGERNSEKFKCPETGIFTRQFSVFYQNATLTGKQARIRLR